ncbi:MAG: FAD:protein FMN transferase [Lachnospiraceae bacterium]|nr:FAD:protein FMN transferase [Lachnospiraceae bacterium]
MKYRRPIILNLCILSLLLLLCGCSRKSEPIRKSGFYFDTVITVTLYEKEQEPLLEKCLALADRYEKMFSNTIADSDISKINAAAGNPVTVSDETIELLKLGIHYGELSDGAFDITVGRLSSLWDFSDNTGTIPGADEIQEALTSIDYHAIEIDDNQVKLNNPDAQLDLGGIAKGYIADRMKDFLVAHGVTNGIINLGGNVLVIGSKSDGSGYTIGIQKPFEETGTAIASVRISDRTVVSSGVYERYSYYEDQLYHHILDTATGYPCENDLLGVSIICGSSADGDALSTITFTKGLDAGMRFIEGLPDTEAIFITVDYEVYTTSGVGKNMDFMLRDF